MSFQINDFGQPIGVPVPNWQPPAWPRRAELQGRYCLLQPVDIERHAASLFEAFGLDKSGKMWTYLPYGPFTSLADFRSWMQEKCSGDDPLFYVICEPDRQQPLGLASYLRITPRSGSIEVGHLLYSPLLQRSTAATEAMYLMMQQAFELGYRRYEWKCDALNANSRAAAQRLGFSFEGIFRQATVYKGRTRDTAWYAVIDRDWPQLRAALQSWLDPANFNAAGEQRTRLTELTKAISQTAQHAGEA